MERRYFFGTRYLILALIGLTLVTVSYLIHVYQPTNLITRMRMDFTPTSHTFELWKTPPTDLLLKVYIFNVTNSEEFLNGEEKLRLQEVGPYTYREVLYHTNTTFHDNGTLSFIPRRRLEFILNSSIGDAATDKFMLPNLALLGITSYMHSFSMFTNLAFNSLSSYLDVQPFNTLTVEKYLFGYDDPIVKLAHTVLPNWIDFPRLGILDRVMALDNASELVTINVKRQPDFSTLTQTPGIPTFGLEHWGSSSGIPEWGYSENSSENSRCNSLEGAFQGTVFPLNMDTNQTLRMYRRSFCRLIPFDFRRKGTTKEGFDVNIFEAAPNFLSRAEENPENDCYCRNLEEDSCPPAGLSNLSPCYYGIPVAMSFPHLLHADPSVSEKIDGMFPNKSRHRISIGIHPELGVPLTVSMSIQLNLMIPETKYNSKTRPFNNLVLPLVWVELNVDEIPEKIQFYINLLCYVLPAVEQVVMLIFAVTGLIMMGYYSAMGLLAIKYQNHSTRLYSSLILSASLRKKQKAESELRR